MMTDPDLPPIEQKVLKIFSTGLGYWTATVSLITFSLALAGFGLSNTLSPAKQLTAVEAGIGAFSLLGGLGVVLHMTGRRGWLPRWSFLMLCAATALVTISFVIGPLLTPRNENLLEPWDRGIVFLLLTTGGMIALSMHLAYGGRRRDD
jgi:hypothetical protein